MKNLIPFLFSIFFIVFSDYDLKSQTTCSDQELFENYWNTRQMMRERFIRNRIDENGNLLSDGIGIWDDQRNRYSDAGFGLAADHILIDDQPPQECGVNGNGGANALKFGADSPYTLGQYLAILATEFAMLSQNGQNEAAEQVLKELFLSLQAYKRLDMTANKLMEQFNEACQNGECIEEIDHPDGPIFQGPHCDLDCEWTPNLSGYSGFFMRQDVPSDFHNNFDNSEFSEDWEVGAIDAKGFFCDDICEFISKKDNVVSQDQVIGLLFGLSFIKKFIPENATIEFEGESYNILNIAQKIANGMVSRIRYDFNRSIDFPPCNGSGVNAGSSASGMFAGMEDALDFIYPDNTINSTVGDEILWEVTSEISSLTYTRWDNVRMVLELLVASGNVDLQIDFYDYLGNEDRKVLLMQLMAFQALHGADSNSDLERNISEMRDLLCTYNCPGPCAQGTNTSVLTFDCENDPGDGWCMGEHWKKTHDQVFVTCDDRMDQSRRNGGYDYMIAYNLLHLLGGIDQDYFNPEAIELLANNETLTGQEFSINPLPPNVVCSSSNFSFDLLDPNNSISEIGVNLGNNLTMSSPFNLTTGSETGATFIEIFDDSNENEEICHTNQKLRIPLYIDDDNFDLELEITESHEPCFPGIFVRVNSPHKDLSNSELYDVTFISVNNADIYYSSSNQASVKGYVDGPFDGIRTAEFEVIVNSKHGCGGDVIQGSFTYSYCHPGDPSDFEDDICFGCRVTISPNPNNGIFNVDLVGFPSDVFSTGSGDSSENITTKFKVVSPFNGDTNYDVIIQQLQGNPGTLINLPKGLYYIQGIIDNQQYQSSFIIDN